MRVAIVILNYNNPVATVRCLNSLKLLKEGKTKFEIILVDNASTDGSVSQIRLNYRDLLIIESPKNLGYAGGNNLGIKKALADGADYVLVLNNDTQIIDGLMLDKLVKTNADIAGPVLKFHKSGLPFVDYGGKVDRLLGRNTHYEYHFGEEPKEIPTPDYLSGSCLLIKSDVFNKIGFFDQKYFLYYEDVDLCLRAVKNNLSLALVKETALYHEISSSTNKLGAKKIKYLAQSHRRFVLSHLPILARPLALIFNLYLSRKGNTPS